ncbi:preprotein translocase subunit YajC [Qipengyuania sp. DSG2-2]|uniref:preprotein translocase subunit YajC n=1 Tax=Qipengyuania sp. DGS2-2 TaxID=3349631 RepID=UPI0036D2C739
MRAQFMLSAAIVALAIPATAQAQYYGNDEVTGGGGGSSQSAEPFGGRAEPENTRQRARITPYIEASQVVLQELSPGSDTVTYTQLAAGVDASVQGRNNGGSVSVRYERNIGYGDAAVDSDTITGIARGYTSVVPQVLTVEAGALAARTSVGQSGSSTFNSIEGIGEDTESEIYSVYGGPTLATQVGAAQVSAQYLFGYNRVEGPDVVPLDGGGAPVDIFDDSTVHSATASVALKPADVLPVGLAVSGGAYQEDISNLDQRVRDLNVRAGVTVPLTPSFAVTGGIGYEDVEVSSRDVARDAAGNPIVDSSGRFVTDGNAPRQIAFETDGLIWDVGVVWRPSSRTSLTASYGRRYDSDTYYGTFSYAPDSRSSLGVSVYDSLVGFGGQLTNLLAAVSTNFTAGRNPLTGDFNGCTSGAEGGGCLNGALGSIRSSVYRSRGVAANYSQQLGRLTAGVGLGYDRRTFLAAQNTVLAAADGLTDENYYATAFVSGPIGRNAGFNTNAYVNYIDNGTGLGGDATVLGAAASYNRNIWQGLSARAAVAVDHLDSELAAEDLTTASALFGLRYDF